MYNNIFSQNQIELIPYIKKFAQTHYLVGGTAIALHLGHRRSIDFDLFTHSKLNKSRIRKVLLNIPYKQIPIFEDYDQLHLTINAVKVTFFEYPYAIEHNIKLKDFISIPDLLTLAAMKAFAIGRRSKWKDYVDLYFIIRDHFTIEEIALKANQIFPQQFSEKLFRQQLAFHNDIDYTESVEYLVDPVSDEEIKQFLIEASIDFL